jgi:hypothetical protein
MGKKFGVGINQTEETLAYGLIRFKSVALSSSRDGVARGPPR